jgi:hypothetical protein
VIDVFAQNQESIDDYNEHGEIRAFENKRKVAVVKKIVAGPKRNSVDPIDHGWSNDSSSTELLHQITFGKQKIHAF